MLFNSWAFVVFLAILFPTFYWGTRPFYHRQSVQVGLLIIASCIFYGFHIPWLVLLLATSLIINGLATQRLLDSSVSASRRKRIAVLTVVANLGALGFFKYASLLAEFLLPSSLYSWVEPYLLQIPLPIGISFYTFQGLSLIIDAYRGRERGLESLIEDNRRHPFQFHSKIWFFISFFPQLVAGPIVKAHEFVNQIRPKNFSTIDWNDVSRKLISGFFLKMVCADNLKDATVALEYPHFLSLGKIDLILQLYGYSFQIFADFCGYSLIAMGLGGLFGYRLPLNFDFPYLSRSITEFWRRWHISLSTWLRDYLYISLGGNRKGNTRTYINLFITMFLGGLWHGAAWSYAFWGTAHGLWLAFERLTGLGRTAERRFIWSDILRVFITFNVVSFLWILFKLPDFDHVIEYVRLLFQSDWHFQPRLAFVILTFSAPIIIYHIWGLIKDQRAEWRTSVPAWNWFETMCLGVLLFLILTNSGTPGAFIYFQF